MLAILLGLGFLVLQSRAQAPSQAAPSTKPTVAFLGMTGLSDPQVGEMITGRIRGQLGTDSSVIAIPREAVERLFSRGILRGPDIRPDDPQALRREVGDVYLAYGNLERIGVA